MKNKTIIFLLTVISIVSLILLFITSNYNTELESQVSHKDNLLSKAVERDSLVIEKTKQYADIIEKYVNNCEFSIGNKKISAKEMARITNSTLNENKRLKDSLLYYRLRSTYTKDVYIDEYNKIINKYKDSLFRFKWQADLVKKDFGITYSIKKTGTNYTATKNSKKLDSALFLFPYYKHKLSSDENGTLQVTTDREYRKKKRKEEKQ